jgi:hypothetical protein
MAGTPLMHLCMFEELDARNTNVILTTSMWDDVDNETGPIELKDI